MKKLVLVPRSFLGRIGSGMALVTAAVATAATSQAAIDLTDAATSITTDLTAAQGKALPIFAIMFGIVLVLGFFKKATH